MAFQKMIDLLREREINDFVGLVEFWNKSAHKYHHRLKFEELSSVLYLKILFVRLTFLKDIGTNKTSCSINILTVKDSDVI